MTAISNNQIAEAINLFLQEKDVHANRKIVDFLAHRRFLGRSKDILEKLENIIYTKAGAIKIKTTSAHKLRDGEKEKLSHFLKRRYGVKEIIFDEHLDGSALGGVRIEARDEVIDLTLKNKVKQLQEYLTKNV